MLDAEKQRHRNTEGAGVRLDTLLGNRPMDLLTLPWDEPLRGQAGIGIRWAWHV